MASVSHERENNIMYLKTVFVTLVRVNYSDILNGENLNRVLKSSSFSPQLG